MREKPISSFVGFTLSPEISQAVVNIPLSKPVPTIKCLRFVFYSEFRFKRIRLVSNGPLAYPLNHSLAPLTHSLAPHRSICSRAPLCSLVCSFAHSLAPELVGRKPHPVIFNQVSWQSWLTYVIFALKRD